MRARRSPVMVCLAPICVTLALGAGVVGADDPHPDPPAASPALVTGVMRCRTSAQGRWGYRHGAETYRGSVSACTLALSDPRVSGEATMRLDFDCHAGRAFPLLDHPADPATALVVWGELEIGGPAGTWAGPFRGVGGADGVVGLLYQGEGTGAYAGWRFLAIVRAGSIEGVVHAVPADPGPAGGRPAPDPLGSR